MTCLPFGVRLLIEALILEATSVCPYMAAISSPSPQSRLFVVVQVLPKGVQRKPPMAVIFGR